MRIGDLRNIKTGSLALILEFIDWFALFLPLCQVQRQQGKLGLRRKPFGRSASAAPQALGMFGATELLHSCSCFCAMERDFGPMDFQ
jgi:hypothetical protein